MVKRRLPQEELVAKSPKKTRIDPVKEHAKELSDLQKSDPDFFKFLQENEPSLLTFGEDLEAEEELQEEEAQDEEEAEGSGVEEELTKERFAFLVSRARQSPSFRKAGPLLAAYRSCIRFIVAPPEPTASAATCSVPPDPKKVKKYVSKKGAPPKEQPRSSKSQKQPLSSNFSFNIKSNLDVEIVIEWLSDAVLEVLEVIPLCFSTSLKFNDENVTAQIIQLCNSKSGRRAKYLSSKFWIETLTLLNYFQEKIAFPAVYRLRTQTLAKLSDPKMLRFLPFSNRKKQVFKTFVTLWLESRRLMPDQLSEAGAASFLVIRNLFILCGRTAFLKGFRGEKDEDENPQEELVTLSLREFRRMAEKVGYSWRTAAGFQFLLNGFCEIFELLPQSLLYNTIFKAIRHLAVTVRNAALTRSRQKSAPKRKKEVEMSFHSWGFLLMSRLLVQVFGRLQKNKKVQILAHPLSIVFTTAIKIDLISVHYVPFVLHCMTLQCQLMENSAKYIPIGAQLVTLGTHLVKRTEDLYKVKTVTSAAVAKAVDFHTHLRFSDHQLKLRAVADDAVSAWIQTLTNFLGLLARHPAFPEVVSPLLFNLKRLTKARNESARNGIKDLLKKCETTATEVKLKRLKLEPRNVPQNILLVLDDDTSLGKMRKKVLLDRAQHVSSCIAGSTRSKEQTQPVEGEEDSGEESAHEEQPQSDNESTTTSAAKSSSGDEFMIEKFDDEDSDN